MSEEAKTPDGDYVMMGATGVTPGRAGTSSMGLDDPNLTQEEKDHRLAIALQQQENAAVQMEHQKKHNNYVKAQTSRTARSGTFTKLAAVRDKDQGRFAVPAEYTTDNAFQKEGEYSGVGEFVPPAGASPQEIADAKMAYEIQKMEQMDAGTTQEMNKIITEDASEDAAQARRTGRSTYNKPKKTGNH
mmetsp:Transcript_21583/g.46756  ORF Transcript_21583/g.46756 Transcript_21583/m.46756 type:complete len:188 (-) Transcript_21583:63-626(-)|eukprot:CAMPEP_0168782142 /NCGR_PEP_ID=MMETSP0725-20121227/9008_1 /TAXON_ID=265536 /ORGANISM="Amphiprora sp., Strain CCMP467" /LENGTH=187 /DNA_ID=CAMNT_0008832059 /DNA_START=262 /DNA_END=825 /DNA_ORIENTATION=-